MTFYIEFWNILLRNLENEKVALISSKFIDYKSLTIIKIAARHYECLIKSNVLPASKEK